MARKYPFLISKTGWRCFTEQIWAGCWQYWVLSSSCSCSDNLGRKWDFKTLSTRWEILFIPTTQMPPTHLSDETVYLSHKERCWLLQDMFIENFNCLLNSDLTQKQCVRVCVCVCERERERERLKRTIWWTVLSIDSRVWVVTLQRWRDSASTGLTGLTLESS